MKQLLLLFLAGFLISPTTQKDFYEKANFSKYPKNWGLKSTDTNIDHRRVPNLQTFFTRHGKKLTVTKNGSDYKPGDIITWILKGNLPHIGIKKGHLATI